MIYIQIAKNIIVGTNKGHILVFTFKQETVAVLSPDKSSYGVVLSVDIAGNGDWVLAGYDTGKLVIWDVKSKKPLKIITESHSAPVTFCQFFDDPSTCISADSEGN